jgi:hypothetical protein
MADDSKPNFRGQKGKFISKGTALRLKNLRKFNQIRRQNTNLPDHNYCLNDRDSVTDETGVVANVSYTDSDNAEWLLGRRIVEIKQLADQLVCDGCGSLLHLRDITREQRYGLASLFDVSCRSCQRIKKISSGKRDNHGGFDINYKVTIGTYSKQKKSIHPCHIHKL